MAEEYITQVSEEIEGRVTKKLSQDCSRTESLISGAFSKLNEFLLNPQVRNCSVAVPGTSRNNNAEIREPTGDRSLNDPYPKVGVSACHASNLIDSEQEETHHRKILQRGSPSVLHNRTPTNLKTHLRYQMNSFISDNSQQMACNRSRV